LDPETLDREVVARNPQVAAEGAQTVSELAFAARLLKPDPAPPPVDAGLPSRRADQADLPLVKASHETPGTGQEDAMQPPPASAIAATALEQDQVDSPAHAPARFAPAVEESRGPAAHDGQPDAKSVPLATLPVTAGREDSPARASRTLDVRPLQPAEPEPSVPPPVSHDVSLRIAEGQSRVEVRMAERAGEIRVTVHTPDQELAHSLRSELPELVGRLHQGGFQAETWRPAPPAQADSGRRSGADGFGGSSQQHSGGARRDGRQQQNPPHWAEAWNFSLESAEEQPI
jgi:hypothetical protein